MSTHLPARASRSLVLGQGDFTACRWPSKYAYTSRAEARRAAKLINREERDSLMEYRCAAGHFHIGHARPWDVAS